MSQFAEALKAANLKILKYDPAKVRPVSTNSGSAMAMDKFCKAFAEKLGTKGLNFPEVFKATEDIGAMEKLVEEHAEENGVYIKPERYSIDIPKSMEGLTLNMNLAAKNPNERFFMTSEDETVSRISGEMYMLCHQMSPAEAAATARKVIPDYLPRGKKGVSTVNNGGKDEDIFNVYTPPLWYKHPEWSKLYEKPPVLFRKLVDHLFPIEEEREFYYDWLHDSLFKRAFTFLILCGDPGIGKNRLKLLMRALHGHVNTVDGKRSTLVERFNSQLSEVTLAWFDELHYDSDMENNMKELQNDSIAIERKGVDATRATKIHASIVISNNKPRDNYIAFDARKFVPLVLTKKRLEESMTSEEIDEITQKCEDQTSKTFDTKFLAQIVKWLKARGRSRKWPHLEYRGPMFWTLAHTSMTRWQKRAVTLLMEAGTHSERTGWDPDKKMFLWSVVQSKAQRKHGDKSLQFPDYTSIQAFFEVFKDGKGRKAFETKPVKGNIMGDFYVKSLFTNTEIITESSVQAQRSKERERTRKKEYLDL